MDAPVTPILEEDSLPADVKGLPGGTTRVDRLLKERIRRNRSHQVEEGPGLPASRPPH